MIAGNQPAVTDAAPPTAVLKIVNPVLRALLRTPMSRWIRPLALLEFRGRHTGQRRRVVVAWHMIDESAAVVTPATWRVNFTEPRRVMVRWGGHDSEFIGTLDTDAHAVATVVNGLLDGGTVPGHLALRVPPGHTVTADDISHTHRAMIRFEHVQPDPVEPTVV